MLNKSSSGEIRWFQPVETSCGDRVEIGLNKTGHFIAGVWSDNGHRLVLLEPDEAETVAQQLRPKRKSRSLIKKILSR